MQEACTDQNPPEEPGWGAREPCHRGTHQLTRFSEPRANSGHMGVPQPFCGPLTPRFSEPDL